MPSVEVYSPECIREFRDKVRRQAERRTGGVEQTRHRRHGVPLAGVEDDVNLFVDGPRQLDGLCGAGRSPWRQIRRSDTPARCHAVVVAGGEGCPLSVVAELHLVGVGDAVALPVQLDLSGVGQVAPERPCFQVLVWASTTT